jgi:hypothetical protein
MFVYATMRSVCEDAVMEREQVEELLTAIGEYQDLREDDRWGNLSAEQLEEQRDALVDRLMKVLPG